MANSRTKHFEALQEQKGFLLPDEVSSVGALIERLEFQLPRTAKQAKLFTEDALERNRTILAKNQAKQRNPEIPLLEELLAN